MENQEDLPLFIYHQAPISVMVFNNELFGFEKCPVETDIHYPYRAYQFLNQLYQSPFGEKIIPPYLRKSVSKEEREWLGGHFGCLTGLGEVFWHNAAYCLDGDFVVKSTEKSSVEFSNISFEKKPLNISIKLTLNEAFLTLSNILSQGYQLIADFRYTEDKFDLEKLKKNDKIDSSTKMYEGIIWNYWLDYTNYIKQMLLDDSLQPLEILRNCGISSLGYLIECKPVKLFVHNIMQELLQDHNLSFNRKLMYYCLIETIDYWNELNFIEDFKAENELLFSNLEREFLKEYQRNSL
jgi:hypothetical protein